MFCTLASAPIPLWAVTVKENDPTVVGVPDSTPSADRVSPSGRVPAATVTCGSGEPDTVYVYEYPVPTTPSGAVPTRPAG